MDKEKRNGICHLIAGLIILYHGFEAFDKGEFLSAAVYFSLAIFCMIFAGLHKKLTKSFVQADTAFFLLEAVTISYSAWHYKTKGQTVLFYIMAAAALFFYVLSLMNIQFPERKRKRSHRKRRRSTTVSMENQEREKNKLL